MFLRGRSSTRARTSGFALVLVWLGCGPDVDGDAVDTTDPTTTTTATTGAISTTDTAATNGPPPPATTSGATTTGEPAGTDTGHASTGSGTAGEASDTGEGTGTGEGTDTGATTGTTGEQLSQACIDGCAVEFECGKRWASAEECTAWCEANLDEAAEFSPYCANAWEAVSACVAGLDCAEFEEWQAASMVPYPCIGADQALAFECKGQ